MIYVPRPLFRPHRVFFTNGFYQDVNTGFVLATNTTYTLAYEYRIHSVQAGRTLMADVHAMANDYPSNPSAIRLGNPSIQNASNWTTATLTFTTPATLAVNILWIRFVRINQAGSLDASVRNIRLGGGNASISIESINNAMAHNTPRAGQTFQLEPYGITAPHLTWNYWRNDVLGSAWGGGFQSSGLFSSIPGVHTVNGELPFKPNIAGTRPIPSRSDNNNPWNSWGLSGGRFWANYVRLRYNRSNNSIYVSRTMSASDATLLSDWTLLVSNRSVVFIDVVGAGGGGGGNWNRAEGIVHQSQIRRGGGGGGGGAFASLCVDLAQLRPVTNSAGHAVHHLGIMLGADGVPGTNSNGSNGGDSIVYYNADAFSIGGGEGGRRGGSGTTIGNFVEDTGAGGAGGNSWCINGGMNLVNIINVTGNFEVAQGVVIIQALPGSNGGFGGRYTRGVYSSPDRNAVHGENVTNTVIRGVVTGDVSTISPGFRGEGGPPTTAALNSAGGGGGVNVLGNYTSRGRGGRGAGVAGVNSNLTAELGFAGGCIIH